jgi:oxygen-independent coproporphyrinogen-3 oxidase
VYFGGGTPTLLSLGQLSEILETVNDVFKIEDGAEITAETNPKTADSNKLRGMRDIGINRLSIGMQSVHDNELRALGRIHTHADFLISFKDARRAGFDNVSADLMYGIPQQTMNSFEESIKSLTRLSPEHISSYCLTVEDGTNFARRRERLELPDEDTVSDMYALMTDILGADGYKKYEISNFAYNGQVSRHNLKYWKREDYLGFGPAAHSFYRGQRYANSQDVESYLNGKDIRDYSEVISFDEAMNEYVMLGMRLSEGIYIDEFNRIFGIDFMERYGNTFKRFSPEYVYIDKKTCRLTDKGMFVSNYILSEA